MKAVKVLSADSLLEVAFAKARKTSERESNRIKGKKNFTPDLARKLAFLIIDTSTDELIARLSSPLKDLPELDSLPRFYKELVESRVGIDNAKKALGHVAASLKLIRALKKEYIHKAMELGDERDRSMRLTSSYYGRLSSIIRKNDKSIRIIQQVSIELKIRDTIRTDLRTVVLAGFPNSGKSTLLSAITKAKPEVASYPFTTKKVSVGHFESPVNLKDVIQIIDTPGLLDRRADQRNEIEEEAVSAMKNLADVVLFLFDLSKDSKYGLESQLNLYNSIKEDLGKPIVCILTKADITDPKSLEELKQKIPDVFEVSAITKINTGPLKEKLTGYLY